MKREIIKAILCDLDGVITQTAKIHAKAWKLMFDEFLHEYSSIIKKKFPEFSIEMDYPKFIDGKSRLDGIRSYLSNINLKLPELNSTNPSEKYTIQNLAKRKNEIYNKLIQQDGIYIYKESVEQLQKWKAKGIKIGVVSSSKNCRPILQLTHLENLFDVIVDGITAEENNLKGKPAPDTFLYAANLLNVVPSDTMLVEDATVGILAGKKGKFKSVVGIIHDSDENELYASGADIAVKDLRELATKMVLTDNVEPIFTSTTSIVVEGFNPYIERSVESILSFGNGYIGSRNSLEEEYNFSEQSTYVAGLYQWVPDSSYNELAIHPDWTRIQIFLDQEKVDLLNSKMLMHKRYVDLNKGLVIREWRSQDTVGRIIYIKIIKYISLTTKNEAVKSLNIIPENFNGRIRVVSGIDGKNIHSNVLFSENQKLEMIVRTVDHSQEISMVQQSHINFDGSSYNIRYSEKKLVEEWEWLSELGKEYIINSSVIFSFQLPSDEKNQKSKSDKLINQNYFESTLASHIKCWENRWRDARITITGNEMAQAHVNFALYHLISSGEFAGNVSSIGARGLTGISYQGHVFWDTEMYLMPFYLFTAPHIAKQLLIYRYHTLNGARENARREGRKGACFAWESTDTGIEMAPTEIISPYGQKIPICTNLYEIHITPDIAFAYWQYWQVTNDVDFLIQYGAEIIFETARFCENLLVEEDDGLFHIKDVVGPDEHHERVDDNAYTNFMASYNLDIALRLNKVLINEHPAELIKLKEKIDLKEEEIGRWETKKDKIYFGYDSETKIYEQFKGYYELEFVDLKKFEPRNVPMDILLEKKIRNTQIVKQADVLMFLFLQGIQFTPDVIEANYNYYEPRTSHGSSLSPSIHSIVAARLGKMDDSYNYFQKNLEIDLNDNLGNASGGIHIASIGGTWMSIIMGFAGMYIYDHGLLFDPHFPDQWRKVEFSLQWRSERIGVTINQKMIQFEISGNKKVDIGIGEGNWRSLEPGKSYGGIKDLNWKWTD